MPLPCLGLLVNLSHVEQATQIDMLVGSVANGLNSSGGFCAGSHIVVDHQRINGTSFVFSAAVPALLAVSASEGINILRNTPSILSTLQENVRAIRAVLDRVDAILARRLADHPHPPAFSGAVIGCDPEGPESIDPCSARATVVRYRRRGARAAGYRGRGTSAGRVDHTCASPARTRARRSAAEHPTRCHCSAVAQGVRARGRRHQSCGHEGACEAEMSMLATGAVPIIRYVCVRPSCSSPYRVPAPVDHISITII